MADELPEPWFACLSNGDVTEPTPQDGRED